MAAGGSRIGAGTVIVVAIAAFLILKPGGSAPSPTPAPEARFGAPFSINGWSVEVWQLGKLEDLMPGEQSLSGEQMWLLDVEMTNTTGHEADIGTGYRLQDANGVIESANPLAPVSPELTGTLAPGGHKRGYLGFELPAGVPPVAVIVRPGDTGDSVTIAIPAPAPSTAVAYPTPTASPSAAVVVSPTRTPAPTAKPRPTPIPTQKNWLAVYCAIDTDLRVAHTWFYNLHFAVQLGDWNQIGYYASLQNGEARAAAGEAKKLPDWPPAKVLNPLVRKEIALRVTATDEYQSAAATHDVALLNQALSDDIDSMTAEDSAILAWNALSSVSCN